MRKLKKFFKQTVRRWSWFFYRERNILNRKIDDFLEEDVKFNFGCGDKKLPGYVNIDAVPTEAADVVMNVPRDLDWIPSGIASEIRLDSVFEHFYRYEQPKALEQFHRILKKGGKLVMMWLPDFDAMIDAYLKKKPGIIGEKYDLFNVYRHTHGDPVPRNSPHQLHKDIFTKDSIRALLEGQGFYVEKLENAVFRGEKLAISINITAVKK